METVDYIAYYAATVATLVFIWDILKWKQSGPKIKSRITNMFYPYLEALENGESKELTPYCHVELINTGSLPTTIMEIKASHSFNKETMIDIPLFGFEVLSSEKMPHVIKSGEVWSCRIEMSQIDVLARYGKPFIEVRMSHQERPMVIELKKYVPKHTPRSTRT